MTKAWAGLDTETQDGKAVLVCTDRASLVFPKSWDAIATFLYLDGRQDFAAYNLAYDARALLHFLPLKAIGELNRAGRTDYRGWKIHYVPRKLLELRPASDTFERTVRCWDTWTFFQGSLDTAAHKILGEGKIAVPKTWMKSMTRQLRSRNRAKVIRYCIRDADLARRLHQVVEDRMEDAGLVVDKPYSPGSYAVAKFKGEIPKPPAPWVQEAFRRSFYGGRIEILKRGALGPVWCYDIRSAYPWAAMGLPTTDGASFREVKTDDPRAIYGSYRVRVRVDPETLIPFYPVRAPDGSIAYPAGEFVTWTDRESLHYGRDVLGHDVEVLEGVECHHDAPAPCYSALGGMFHERQVNPNLSLPWKLVMNSLYGKLASTIERWHEPEFPDEEDLFEAGTYWRKHEEFTSVTNFPQAATITARTRIRVHDLARRAPARCAAFATDGVVMVGDSYPPLVSAGSSLGDWAEPERWDRAVLVMAGVGAYWRGTEYKQVNRGMRTSGRLAELLEGPQARKGPILSFQQNVAGGICEYLRTQDRKAFNAIVARIRRLDVNADTKRAWPGDWENANSLLKDWMDSEPLVYLPA